MFPTASEALFAYTDPAFGSYVWQLALAVASGGVYYVWTIVGRVRPWLSRFRRSE